MTSSPDPSLSLDPDDPRLSEWIDGRLPSGEAAAVEQAVRGSESLSRLVADLRAVKEAAAAMPAAEPPEGFVDQVMRAIVETGPGGSDERVVNEEWRSIETERLAAERVEADADADLDPARGAAAPGRPWPLLSLAGALAAGLLVAVLLNLPGGDRREVALGPADPERLGRAATDPLPASPEAAAPRRGEPSAQEPPDARQFAARESASEMIRRLDQAAVPKAAAGPGRPLAEDGLLARAGGNLPSDASRTAAEPQAAASLDAARRQAALVDAVPGPAEPIAIQVWGAEGREAFVALLEESGLEHEPSAPASAAGKAAGPLGDEPFFLIGEADAVAAFLTRVGAERAQPGADAGAEGGEAAAATGPVRVRVRIVEAPGVAPAAPK
jgi:hypothetical protein